MSLSIVIPACNEEAYIGDCLASVMASVGPEGAQVVVAANGCTDDTVAQAQAFVDGFAEKGWRLLVLDLPGLGKHGAMDAGDAAAVHKCRVYLDADVLVSPTVLAEVARALDTSEARYVSGTPIVTARSWITRAYARFWVTLPFVAQGVPGFGLYAVNALGRARWGQFPAIISDDTFVRVQFTPEERVKVPGTYRWPMVEGFRQLVRVRRRQDQGVAEMAELHPDLMANEGKARIRKSWVLGRLIRDPIAFVTYAAVTVAVRAGWGTQEGWVRGR